MLLWLKCAKDQSVLSCKVCWGCLSKSNCDLRPIFMLHARTHVRTLTHFIFWPHTHRMHPHFLMQIFFFIFSRGSFWQIIMTSHSLLWGHWKTTHKACFFESQWPYGLKNSSFHYWHAPRGARVVKKLFFFKWNCDPFALRLRPKIEHTSKLKKNCYYFSKRKWKYFYTFHHFYSEKSSKRAKEHKSTTMTPNLPE